jgi:hypothetical protein
MVIPGIIPCLIHRQVSTTLLHWGTHYVAVETANFVL